MLEVVRGEHALVHDRRERVSRLHVCVWILFGLLVARFIAVWLNAFAETSIPVPGRIGFTVIFASFSLAHASSSIGWRRALAFLVVCAAVSWSFEEAGIATGRIYGPYHYGDQLGPKLGDVPLIIPFAWFMMVYASWGVAWLLLEGTGEASGWQPTIARIVVASFAMTAWDTVMDPGMARAGVWTWEQGGAYFGVPLQNYVGWLATTSAVYLLAELVFRQLPSRAKPRLPRVYTGLPAMTYGLIALDRLLLPDLAELRVVAAFGMIFVALLAAMRLALPSRP